MDGRSWGDACGSRGVREPCGRALEFLLAVFALAVRKRYILDAGM